MRVLVLSEIFPPAIGGSGELLRNVYLRVQTDGTRVFAGVLDDGVAGTGQDGPLTVVREPMRVGQWGVLNGEGWRHHWREARRIRRAARRRDTMVHVARVLPEGVGAWLASQFGGPRYVCWAHGEDVASASTSRELAWLMRRVFGGASAVLANSHNTARMVAAVGVPATKIAVVHPGVDADRFAGVDPAAAARFRATLAAPGETLVLIVGRLQRRKGHDVLVGALSRLRAAGRAVRGVIVGDGEERPRIEKLMADLGLTDRVRLAGAVQTADLPLYYAAADVFCHPNRIDGHDVEGFGIVFLEAAAAGLPVIGGNSGGVPEAIEAGVTGVLVSGTDEAELASAIARLADGPALRASMGEAGRRRVRAEFSWERAARIVEKVQNDVVARR